MLFFKGRIFFIEEGGFFYCARRFLPSPPNCLSPPQLVLCKLTKNRLISLEILAKIQKSTKKKSNIPKTKNFLWGIFLFRCPNFFAATPPIFTLCPNQIYNGFTRVPLKTPKNPS